MRVALVSVAFAPSMVGSSFAASLGWNGQPDRVNNAGKPAICLPVGTKEPFPISRLVVAENYATESANWGLTLELSSLPWGFSPEKCVVFEEALPGYAKGEESVLVKLDRNFTHVFMSRVFCAKTQADGSLNYVQWFEDSEGRTVRPVCSGSSAEQTP